MVVARNWTATRTAKAKNIAWGENRSMATPPARFPRTPPAEEAIQTKDWSSPEEEEEEEEEGGDGCFCFPSSATMASLATSTMEAPRLLRRR